MGFDLNMQDAGCRSTALIGARLRFAPPWVGHISGTKLYKTVRLDASRTP